MMVGNKLPQQQKDFLRLVLRSPDVGDGWRSVSPILVPVTKKQVASNPELFETRDEDGFLIRLTERARIVTDYL